MAGGETFSTLTHVSDHSQYRPEEFFPILAKLPKGGDVVICGGQAVNLLAAVFLPKHQIDEILGIDGSATSGDMDIVITKELQSKISAAANKSKGFSVQLFADCRQPIQFAILSEILPDTRIDVMRNINGIHMEKDRVFEESLELEHIPYGVMNPVTLLMAKAINCATLEQDTPQQKRNDVKHLQLLVPIVHNYLAELVDSCPPVSAPNSKAEQRVIMGFLKKLDKIATSATFKKGMTLAKVHLKDAIPIRQIKASRLSTLQTYMEKSFMPTARKTSE
jgi:hypothetical protein